MVSVDVPVEKEGKDKKKGEEKVEEEMDIE